MPRLPLHPPPTAHRRAAARGSTLLEVLVAILVLSIGMLGIAGLQISSLRYSQGGWARAAVAASLSDLADRVRNNPDSIPTAYVNESKYATERAAIEDGSLQSDFADARNCDSKTCTPAQLALYQSMEWRLAVARDIPGGAGYVTGSSATGYVATVLWIDKDNPDVPAICQGDSGGIATRTCCPDATGVKNVVGMRCTNMVIVP